ncbi:MAG: glucuronate isomerase [Puniceicoccaceae bacterium 5H]|nr:MAG: glucuronate isomerase [Puniceicoccaceae bacterium 5H]
MAYLDDNFLLNTSTAQKLFHEVAAHQPIIDYHCHLSPRDLAENRHYHNLTEIWLEGDHYKWRAMRANGEPEKYCTGDEDPREKFQAFARTVPYTMRNPLYNWTHLELKRYFGIHKILNADTAQEVWDEANQKLRQKNMTTWGILERFRVKVIGTTDDPCDDLHYHKRLKDSDCPAKVVPSFRPDKAMQLHDPKAWNLWMDNLGKAAGNDCATLEQMLEALDQRHGAFHQMGGRASDHGLESLPTKIAETGEAERIFEAVRSGRHVNAHEQEAFNGFLLCFIGELNKKRKWAMQYHLGALRNVNKGLFDKLGPDVGVDSISDKQQIEGLATILGELSRRQQLPKTILYNLNPAQNYAFATMATNFAEGGVPGKMQFGSGWWFLDQLEGMNWQLNALSNLGLLRRFVGMLTDSRSLMSYCRHEYFRRLLCKLLGDDVQAGLLPDAPELRSLVQEVCFQNARHYFGFDV